MRKMGRKLSVEDSARIYDAAVSCLKSCQTIGHLEVGRKFAKRAMAILEEMSCKSGDFCSEAYWSIHGLIDKTEKRLNPDSAMIAPHNPLRQFPYGDWRYIAAMTSTLPNWLWGLSSDVRCGPANQSEKRF